MNLNLKNKIALVTGASAGIGKACALSLAQEGCKVIICSRDSEKLKKAALEIEKLTKNKVDYIVADLTKKEDIEKLNNDIIKKYTTIHILINNCGGPAAGSVFDLKEEQWSEAFDKVLMSVLRLTKLFLPNMQKQKFGRIITITSTSVKQPIPNLLLSNSLRAAVTGFSKTISDEVAKDNITVNCIAPGHIDTERQIELAQAFAKKQGKSAKDIIEQFKQCCPMKRMGKPSEIGDVAAFLASEKASFITGQTIVVDGGRIRSIF